MKKIKLLMLLCLFLPLISFAQETQNTKKPIKYTMIIEGGITNGSPVSIFGELALMHGIKLDNRHFFALAFGIGGGYAGSYGKNDWDSEPFYMPVYFHYRYLIASNRKVTPFVSASLGGLINHIENHNFNYGGIYSSITAGFQISKFFLAGGLSFTPMESSVTYSQYVVDPWLTIYNEKNQFIFPVGIVLHIGLTF